MKIESAKQLQMAERSLNILRAERAGFGIPKNAVDRAMIASIEGQIISVEQDIMQYKLYQKLTFMNQIKPE